MKRPAVFVGSSSEGLKIAHAIQLRLDQDCEVEPWNQGVFGLTQGTLESLVQALPRFDFAILVLTADDLARSRGHEKEVARDNVLFELGLFMGALGRERTFMIYDRSNPPALPSDLAGITATTFEPHSSGNLEAALGAACTKILQQIEKHGIRPERSLQGLTEAAESVEGIGTTMQNLITLLARSRKVELDIISAQFGPVIPSGKLKQMQQDLQDLDKTLIESNLRTHPEVSALYKYPDRKRAAEAAIAFFCNGAEPAVRTWKSSTTWNIVETAYKELAASA
jgi:hypothetical protein